MNSLNFSAVLQLHCSAFFLLNFIIRISARKKKSVDYLLACLMFCLYVVFLFNTFYGQLISNPYLYNTLWGIRYFFYIMIPPLFFLFVLSYLSNNFKLEKIYYFAFIPSVIFLIVFVILSFLNKFFFNIIIYDNIFSFRMLYLLSIIVYGIVFCYIFIFLIRYTPAKERKIPYYFMHILLFSALIGFLLDYLGQKELAIYFLTVLLLVYTIIRSGYSNIFSGYRKAVLNKRANNYLKHIDQKKIETALDLLLEKEKIYLQKDVSLVLISKKIEVSSHQLSEFINIKYGKSFNNFINSYRIKEAVRILELCDNRKILAVCYDSGFNTPSAFYRAFRAETGLTPSQYMEKINKR